MAALRDRPMGIPPMMVEPLRLVPGTRAKALHQADLERIERAVISSTDCTRVAAAGRFSGPQNHEAAEDDEVVATMTSVNRCSCMLPNSSASTTAGKSR